MVQKRKKISGQQVSHEQQIKMAYLLKASMLVHDASLCISNQTLVRGTLHTF